MIALPPLQNIVHDIFLSFGLGFFIAVFYSILRLVFGKSKVAVLLCDISTIVIGAIFYFAISVQALSVGIMRWYTAIAVIGGHLLCIALWGAFVQPMRRIICAFLLLPYTLFVNLFKKISLTIIKKRKTSQKKFTKSNKNNNKHLKKTYKVLYNSMYNQP